MTRPDWPLVVPNDDGIRPAGPPDACFYCGQKVGQPHGERCVCVKKLIRARYTIVVEVNVPHHWTASDFEFHRNQSSSCKDNLVNDIEKFVDTLDDRGECLCSHADVTFLGVVDDTPTRELKSDAEIDATNVIRAGLDGAGRKH